MEPRQPPYPAEVEEDLQKLMPPGMPPIALFRMLAHNPRVLRRIRRGGLLGRGSISLRERELVILRTTARCGSEYEWGVHVAFFSAAAGLSAAEIAATVSGNHIFNPRETLLLAACDALHDTGTIPESICATFEPAQLIEIVVLAGLYHMISFVTQATRVPLEPSAPRFPTSPPPAPPQPPDAR